MSRTARTRTTGVSLLAGVLAAALALTGCSAGQVTSTAQQVSATSGSNVEVGPIAVRDAVIAFADQPVEGGVIYAAGADAPLIMTIVNEGAEGDRIVSASSAWANEVAITGDATVPAGRAVVIAGEPAGTQIALVGLVGDIRAGVAHEVVLTFERAGELRLLVPVGETSEPREEPAE